MIDGREDGPDSCVIRDVKRTVEGNVEIESKQNLLSPDVYIVYKLHGSSFLPPRRVMMKSVENKFLRLI
jgi:hypothetical protein